MLGSTTEDWSALVSLELWLLWPKQISFMWTMSLAIFNYNHIRFASKAAGYTYQPWHHFPSILIHNYRFQLVYINSANKHTNNDYIDCHITQWKRFILLFLFRLRRMESQQENHYTLEAKQTPTKKTFKLLLISFKAKLLCANDFEWKRLKRVFF